MGKKQGKVDKAFVFFKTKLDRKGSIKLQELAKSTY